LAWMVGNAPTLYSFGDYCIACLPHPYRKLLSCQSMIAPDDCSR
jgi:hypothetical protein